MKWERVCVESIAYRLPDEQVSSASLEARLQPLYSSLGIASGQIEALTGIRYRRMWPSGPRMSTCATEAAREALASAGIDGRDLGAVVYAGVCRDNLEPATACAVADALGAGPDAFVFDLSNACLGILNGMVELANRIELGQIRAGIVVSAESSREIVDSTIARLNEHPTLAAFRTGLATLTGGSGAVAVVLTEKGFSGSERRLVGGAVKAAPAHHRICRWGPARGLLGETSNVMETEATEVLEHGIELAKATWRELLKETGWRQDDVDRVICHQVGEAHRREVLRALEIDVQRDFSTFTDLGNIGTVSLPMTAAKAHEEGFLSAGDRVGFLGIGSGLNCLMLAVQW
jgi:acyl-CoA:acyl-CoA alkyltransferase